MEPLEHFLAFLNRFITLSPEDFQTIMVPFIKVRTYKKKGIVTAGGEVEGYINFVHQGLVRKYFKKEDVEYITQISKEGQIIYSRESFYSRTPSDFVIEAVEPSILLSIKAEDMDTIFQTNAQMERMGRLIITHVMVMHERWQMSLLKLTPRERFLQFVQNNSDLMQRVPQKYLASLLNIQPETFSRFKHLVRNSGSVGGGAV